MASKRIDLPPISIPTRSTESDSLSSESRNGREEKFPGQGLTIREIRQSMAQSPVTTKRVPVPPPASKKKPSLFGGLFQKEPSLAALHQVTTQMAGQHGGVVNARTLPHVSSQKMPQHVPKVNTKWDGVPDAVKAKEKQERDRRRTNRNSTILFRNGSRGGFVADGLGSLNQRRHSIAASWDSRSTGSRPEFVDEPHRADSIYTTSSGGSIIQPKPASIHSQSFRSPSGTSLPEITAYFPDDIPTTSNMPRVYLDSSNLGQYSAYSSDRGSDGPKSSMSWTPVESIPEHTTSPLPSPTETSPQTPLTMPDERNSSAMLSTRKSKSQPIDAFLAGEAQLFQLPEESSIRSMHVRSARQSIAYSEPPIGRVEQNIQKRPDSSRARLGLRASMVVRTDAAPWELQDLNSPKLSPRLPASPRSRRRLFAKDKS